MNARRKKLIALCSFNLLFFILIAFITDRIIPYITKYNFNFNERYIRLSEFKPLIDIYVSPSSEIQQEYNFEREYRFRTDAEGFIIPSKIYSNPDKIIVFLGGSTTECTLVNEEMRFPYLVGRKLEEIIKIKINSYNSGKSGNNTLHMIDILLNKVIPLNPNIVCLMENINDLTLLLYERTYWSSHPSRSVIIEIGPSVKRGLKDIAKSTLPNIYLLLAGKFNAIAGNQDEWLNKKNEYIYTDDSLILESFVMNLRIFVNICKIKNITPVLMTQANRLKVTPDPKIESSVMRRKNRTGLAYHEFKKIYDSFNEAIREVAKKENVILIDLAQKVPQERKYMYDIMHYNDIGSLYVSNLICESLKNIINQK